ncbi:MAG TPA: glutaredoxin family protein [Tepidisphaeraceae bacterium]|nr:glutaredoxin family protein [Tepidisphaeraceae bacterium]
METIKVYGAGWCEDTQRTRDYLDHVGMSYEYLDVDADPEAKQWVVQHNGGKQKTPTVVIDDQILVEPENSDLENALRRAGAH